jgi:rubrerythrin
VDANKLKLAEMIARDLEAQGKTDYTPEELEVIIEIYLDDLNKSDEKHGGGEEDFKSTNYETFSDEDLRLLIANFAKLSEDEQQHLIKFISIMEKSEPDKVARLQESFENKSKQDENGNVVTIDDDDDDEEDYNFNDLILKIN